MAGHGRKAIVAELEQAREAQRAAERKAGRAMRRLRDLEKVLAKAVPRMRTWVALPVNSDSIARGVLTTDECRQILAVLDGSKQPDPDESGQQEKKEGA